MNSDIFITPTEMREIAVFCDILQPLWDSLVRGHNGLSFEIQGFEGITVFDSNGDVLGTVTWADDGAAFYPNTKED